MSCENCQNEKYAIEYQRGRFDMKEEIINILIHTIAQDQRMTRYTAETIREAISKIKELP